MNPIKDHSIVFEFPSALNSPLQIQLKVTLLCLNFHQQPLDNSIKGHSIVFQICSSTALQEFSRRLEEERPLAQWTLMLHSRRAARLLLAEQQR